MFIYKSLYGCLTLAVLLIPVPAHAQAPATATSNVLVYDAGFFAAAQPATAYDMIQRLPAFLFDDGTDVRGFAGAAGNVLIDGARPTAKTDDLTAILHRIPASHVARIAVIRGGAPGIDMQGRSVVANVILVRDTSTTIIATLENTFFWDSHDAPGGSLQFSHRGSAGVYNLTITRYTSLIDDSAGDGFFVRDQPGIGVARGRLRRRGAEGLGWSLNGDAALPLWGGSLGANITLQQHTFNRHIIYGAPLSTRYFEGQLSRPFELGLNWKGNVGEKAELTVLALQRLSHFEYANTARDPDGSQLFDLASAKGETILRSTLRYRWSESLTLESGLEGAYNTLNGTSGYVQNGAPVALPAANSRVNERRGEVFAQVGWRIAPHWALEAGAREEFSHLSALGAPPRSLSFLKPRLLVTWSPDDWGQLRLRAEKVVGQLDFSNFVANADLAGNGVSAGNLALKPDQRWQFEAAWEYHFWDRGAVVLSAMHEQIKDLVDYVPIGAGLDGPGNIAHATNDELKIDLTWPLDRLGLAGAALKGSMKWDLADVTDPVTGHTRGISDQRDKHIQFDYLQDIPAWHSSLDLTLDTGGWSRPSYRINQVSWVRIYSPYVQITWSYKPRPGLEFAAALDNALPYHLDIEQYNYAGARDTAPLSEVLDARNSTQPRIYIQIRKTF
jgi:outer membrane receptor protein involved in Fe transport